ncbi:MAG: chromosomal replication initiator protein DnaA [Chloroflexota bacterium]|nr:chromosomal replication initiator protein DnaA [Chloroflexota bacterium]
MEENENPKDPAARSLQDSRPNNLERNDQAAETRQIWQTALRDLQGQMVRADYDSWIKNLSLLELRGGRAFMSAPSSFAKRRLESEYGDIIQQALIRVVGEQLEVYFTVDQPAQSQFFEELPPAQSPPPTRGRAAPATNGPLKRNSYGGINNGRATSNQQSRPSEPKTRSWNNASNNSNNSNAGNYNPTGAGDYYNNEATRGNDLAETRNDYTYQPNLSNGNEFGPGGYGYDPLSRNGSGLNPRYVFDKYVEGSSNRVATAAAKRVAEMPGYSYNPLFIYGQVGLGKTHLLHAIGHEALRRRPQLNVLYVSSEKFTNDLVNSIKEGRMEDFRSRYRTIDLLMIDDIQFIAGKNTTQEEFFHTFNSLVEANKQVIISSDRPPRAMLVLEERLRSRFEGGLTCDIQPPDYEMRLAILKAKADYQDINVPYDVLEFIAHKYNQSNIRELEGALTRVVAFALHNHATLSVEQAAQALNDLMLNSRKKMVTPARIVEQVGQFFSVDQKELRGRSRSQDIVLPRQIAMYIIREQTEVSLVEIGQELGGRDHTTVMHGIDKMEREIESNPSLRQQINTIIQILYSEGGLK